MDIKTILTKNLKASITVEASLSFTIMAFIIFLMIGPLFIIKTSSDLLLVMNEASKKRCNYEMLKYNTKELEIHNKVKNYISDIPILGKYFNDIEDIANTTFIALQMENKYDENNLEYKNINYMYNINNQIYDEDKGIVKYDYEVGFNLPYNILFISNIKKRLVVNRRAFIGAPYDRFTNEEDNGEYIYVANNYTNSSVYHIYINCTHLKKNTYEFLYSNLSDMRNENNGKYSKCTYCFDGIRINENTICFATSYGDRFHYKNNCPLMTAYVSKIPKSSIEEYKLRLCERCKRKEENE